jgi:hypothetical protein
MMEIAKVAKLIPRLRCLVATLEGQHDLIVHRQINQFFYMQKSEELKILLAQAEEAQWKLKMAVDRVDTKYAEVFYQWQKDARWLNVHLRRRAPSKIE